MSAAAQTYADTASELLPLLDRSSFDAAELSFQLAAGDITDIAAMVDARIATQVYAGSLRGAAGTLAAGAGNALDQALLLREVLTGAGYETRIARATLSPDDARRLIAQSEQEVEAPAATTQTLEEARAILTRLEELNPEIETLTPLAGWLERGFAPVSLPAGLLTMADETGLELPDGAALDKRILAEAREYYWVQARLSGLDPWQDLHIAFRPDSLPSPEAFLPGGLLPEDLRHRLSIALELEILEGEGGEFRLRRIPLMQEQTVDMASLDRRPMLLAILPDVMLSGDPAADPDRARFFLPLWNDRLAPGAVAFTRQGRTRNAGQLMLGGSMAALDDILEQKVGGLLSVLDNTGDAPRAESIARSRILATAVVARLTYRAPDGSRRSFSRLLLDSIGPQARAATPIAQWQPAADAPPFMGFWSIHAITGPARAAEFLDLQIRRIGKFAETGNPPPANPSETALFARLYQAVARAAAGAQALTYNAEPFVLITGTTYDSQGRRQVVSDILQTGLRTLRRDGEGTWRADPLAAFRAGQAQTLLEALLAGPGPELPGVSRREGAWQVLSQAPVLTLVKSPDQLTGLDLPEHARQAATADLERGAWLAVAPGDSPAWWRIDPLSGATIGADAYGRGGEFVEYLSLTGNVLTVAFWAKGAYECGGNLCCQAANAAWAILGNIALNKLKAAAVGFRYGGLTTMGAASEAAALEVASAAVKPGSSVFSVGLISAETAEMLGFASDFAMNVADVNPLGGMCSG